VLKLETAGYALHGLTGLLAFFFTWQQLHLTARINSTRQEIAQLEMQIESRRGVLEQVQEVENQYRRLEKNLALTDSLSRGHDEFLMFLKKLNASVQATRSLVVDEILKVPQGFAIKGTSWRRDNVPVLAEKLERAKLRKMVRNHSARGSYLFELERISESTGPESFGHGLAIVQANATATNIHLSRKGEHSDSLASKTEAAAGTALRPSVGETGRAGEEGQDHVSRLLNDPLVERPAVVHFEHNRPHEPLQKNRH